MNDFSAKANVVPLKRPEKNMAGFRPLCSAPLADAIEKARSQLIKLLQGMFDRVDDALFELADRAENNAEQNLYFESMREVRIRRRTVETEFIDIVDNYVHQLNNGVEPSVANTSQLDDMSSQNLSLVDNDEMEELVAIDTMINKALARFELQLMHFSIRLHSLINKKQVTEKNNPFGPSLVCQAFAEACLGLDIDIKAKLVVFKLLDRYVVSELGGIYESCNKMLIEQGVMPKIRQQNRKSSQASQPSDEKVDQKRETAQQKSETFFNELCNMLAEGSDNATPRYVQMLLPRGQAPAISQAMMADLLLSIQRQQLAELSQQQQRVLSGAEPEPEDILKRLDQQLSLRNTERQYSLGAGDDSAINLVSMLFKVILNDSNMAAPLKSLVASLQLPILRMALSSSHFFEQNSHPARRLLNEIAAAGVGWTPSNNVEADPFYKKVSAIVAFLLERFDGDESVFAEALADFAHFVDLDRKRADLVEQRTIDAEDGKAKTELARANVQRLLAEKMSGKALPKVVIKLLRDVWSNVLFLICLQKGTECREWHDAVATVEELLWSVDPSPEISRIDRMQRIPPLLKELRSGMDTIGFNAVDTEVLFDDLQEIHKRCLSSRIFEQEIEVEEIPDTSDIDLQANSVDQDVVELCDEGLASLDDELDTQLGGIADVLSEFNGENSADDTLNSEKATESADSESDEPVIEKDAVASEPVAEPVRLDSLKVGNWFEFRQSDNTDKKFQCRLVAIIRATQKYIFVNRAGIKVAERTSDQLSEDLANGLVAPIEQGMIFDRALESIITNLRDSKSNLA